MCFVYAVPQVVHITPHGGVAPPMPSHSQSGPQQQQQQQTPQQPTSSGHQTPTPSQHTPYAVQQVGPGIGMVPSAAGTPPQALYHAITQHPVIAPQGPAPPSPQVVLFVIVTASSPWCVKPVVFCIYLSERMCTSAYRKCYWYDRLVPLLLLQLLLDFV